MSLSPGIRRTDQRIITAHECAVVRRLAKRVETLLEISDARGLPYATENYEEMLDRLIAIARPHLSDIAVSLETFRSEAAAQGAAK